MNDKNKAILGLVIFLGASLYLILSGLGEKYFVVMWVSGAFSGLAFSKLRK